MTVRYRFSFKRLARLTKRKQFLPPKYAYAQSKFILNRLPTMTPHAAAPKPLLAPSYARVAKPALPKLPAAGLRIGDYLIGDDSSSDLFGHPDIRY